MLELYKQLITNQYQAVLHMLADAVDKCPDELWHEPVAELKVCQVVFHTLFFTDVYLGRTAAMVREQPFHQQHAGTFADYEELEPRRQVRTYEKPFIDTYVQHCCNKVDSVLQAETQESLDRRPGFDWLPFSRAEVHVYNIRHIHHHAAQLSLHLRTKTGEGIDWYRSGWDKSWRED